MLNIPNLVEWAVPLEFPYHLSFSRMETFCECQRKFFFKYVLDIASKWEGIDLAVGKLIHKAFAVWRLEGKEKALKVIENEYPKEVEEYFDPSSLKHMPLKCRWRVYDRLKKYFDHYEEYDKTETLAVERAGIHDLFFEGEVFLKYRIDRIARDPITGLVFVEELKTRSSKPSDPVREYGFSGQFDLYSLPVFRNYLKDQDTLPCRLNIIAFRFGDDSKKLLDFVTITPYITHSGFFTGEIEKVIEGVWLNMKGAYEAKNFPPTGKFNGTCFKYFRDCPYKPLCQCFDIDTFMATVNAEYVERERDDVEETNKAIRSVEKGMKNES